MSKKFFRLQENYINRKSHDALILDSFDSNSNLKKAQKQRLIENEEMAYNQAEKLERIKRTTIDMDDRQTNIMRDLEKQTGQLKAVNKKTIEMNSDIDESDQIVNRMWRRERRFRLLKYVFISSLLIAFMIVLYFKFLY
jgi:hypothetical protein